MTYIRQFDLTLDSTDWDNATESLYYRSNTLVVLYDTRDEDWNLEKHIALRNELHKRFGIVGVHGEWIHPVDNRVIVVSPFCNGTLCEFVQAVTTAIIDGTFTDKWFSEAEEFAIQETMERYQ